MIGQNFLPGLQLIKNFLRHLRRQFVQTNLFLLRLYNLSTPGEGGAGPTPLLPLKGAPPCDCCPSSVLLRKFSSVCFGFAQSLRAALPEGQRGPLGLISAAVRDRAIAEFLLQSAAVHAARHCVNDVKAPRSAYWNTFFAPLAGVVLGQVMTTAGGPPPVGAEAGGGGGGSGWGI